jgi:hypothetical protein
MGAGKMNRKHRKELGRRLQSANPGLEVVHPRAAGIDVGNGAHYVAVRPEQDAGPVRRFECFTADLHRMADWLEACERTKLGAPEGDHRDGSPARPAGIPHAEIRSRVRRQRHSVLRAKTS